MSLKGTSLLVDAKKGLAHQNRDRSSDEPEGKFGRACFAVLGQQSFSSFLASVSTRKLHPTTCGIVDQFYCSALGKKWLV